MSADIILYNTASVSLQLNYHLRKRHFIVIFLISIEHIVLERMPIYTCYFRKFSEGIYLLLFLSYYFMRLDIRV